MTSFNMIEVQIILIACLTAVACSVPGTFLVLRRMSMIADAVSHSILLGIVCAFFIVRTLDSPLLVIAAALTGLFTVFLVEIAFKTKLLKEDAAIGVIYPFMFSIAVMLITLFADNIHLDTDIVLMGDLAFAPFNHLTIRGVSYGPIAFYQIGTVMVLNILFVAFFYKELKVAIFDPSFMRSLDMSPGRILYLLMFMVALTIVVAFEVVGSIMVIGLIVGPSIVASYYTKRLSFLMFLAPFFAIVSTVSGYYTASAFDVSISGCIVSIIGVIFILSVIIAPKKGLISKFLTGKNMRNMLSVDTLLVHVYHHELSGEADILNNIDVIRYNFNWKSNYMKKIINICYNKGLLRADSSIVTITKEGKNRVLSVIEK